MEIALLGAGAWGTALAIAFADRCAVRLWSRDAGHARTLAATRRNERFLPGCPLPSCIRVENDLTVALAGADLAIVATPMAGLRATLASIARLQPDLPLLWACKGLEAGSGLLPHQVAHQVAPHARCGALTGPSFADEVARGLPAAIVLAARDASFASHWVHRLNGPRLRLYANTDIVGAEVGGAVKNVLAIACGVCDGLGLGLNARAALLTRGLAEITRFGIALGAQRATFMGLAGLGDLVLTCTGDLSRNRRVGLALASGERLEDIRARLGHVAEGVPTTHEVAQRARALRVDMPITFTVADLLDGRLDAPAAVERLMQREPRTEAE